MEHKLEIKEEEINGLKTELDEAKETNKKLQIFLLELILLTILDTLIVGLNLYLNIKIC